MAITDYFITCTRKRETETLNTRNRYVKSYANTPINGYLGKGTPQQISLADKITVKTKFNFYCDDFDLRYDDIVLYEEKNYEVLSIQNTAHKEHHIKAIVQLIENVK